VHGLGDVLLETGDGHDDFEGAAGGELGLDALVKERMVGIVKDLIPVIFGEANGKLVWIEGGTRGHGENLAGRDRTPALSGNNFLAGWSGRDAAALFDRIKTTMPQSDPGSLSDEGYAAIVAYVLDANGNGAANPLDRQSMRGITIAR